MAFPVGQDSLLNPDLLVPGAYARSFNMVNRGGVLQCRPGYRCKFVLPRGNVQGATFFRPRNSLAVIVFAVSGLLYISEAPFTSYSQLTGVQFLPEARQVFFQQVEQSVTLNDDLSITVIDQLNLLVAQDGGTAQAVVFDGTRARHTTDIPMGGPMAFVGDRLWVARGRSLFASDIGNPLSFLEPLYIAGASSSFTLPAPVTALAKVPSTELPQLVAFTDTSTTLFQAGIRARAQWIITPNFQKEIFPEIGCVANRSVVSHFGELRWYSLTGMTSMDAAAQANVSSTLPSQDAPMTDSKSRLSSDLAGICTATFEDYLLVSVPHADKLNTHTWVLDEKPLPNVKGAWNSVWTGTRPIEWLYGSVDGVNRALFLSADYDGESRLWEAFTPDRLDSGCPITWWFETRGISFGLPAKDKDFRYANIFCTELSGTVDVAVFWAGSARGKFKRVMTKRIVASRGTLRSGQTIKATDKVFALKKQSRSLWTVDGKDLATSETLSAGCVESPSLDFRDESFQLLIVGSGPGAVKSYIIFADEANRNVDDSGRVEKDETEENFVRFDGAAAEADTFQQALSEFEENIPLFSSTRTEQVSQGGLTEIAVGSATSVISQINADRIASTIARRKASAALEAALPKIVSLGLAANQV